jgi:hypothetical protein
MQKLKRQLLRKFLLQRQIDKKKIKIFCKY